MTNIDRVLEKLRSAPLPKPPAVPSHYEMAVRERLITHDEAVEMARDAQRGLAMKDPR